MTAHTDPHITTRKQVHLAAHFPGVNNTTVWTDPAAKSQVEFSSFRHLAQKAESGLFDFFFLAEGLRLREHRGHIHDLDVVGRPDTFTVLAGLAAVTEKLGLAGTINTTFNEPFEVARQFASLDYLSGGRSAWNAVTSSDAFTGANFRRGGYLDHADRYRRAEAFLTIARQFFAGEQVDVRNDFFDVHGELTIPPSPQGGPVVLQAGDSSDGRDFAARNADGIFSAHGTLEDGKQFYQDVHARVLKAGRNPEDFKILPGAAFVLGDSQSDAEEKARAIRLQQVSPQTAIAFLEQVWGRDLSDYDPDGPIPDIEPDFDATITRGRVRHGNPADVARGFRERAEAENLSIRELIIATTARQQFVGTAKTVAAQINQYVQEDAVDGFILVPHLTPTGLDEFVDTVVPELQDLGSYRTEYTGTTLRDHLGLPVLSRQR